MKKKIKWVIILPLLVILGVIGYNYIYQDHRVIENEKAEFTMPSGEIAQLFSDNPDESKAKFLNKTIVVSGVLSKVEDSGLTLDDLVFCQLSNSTLPHLENESEIKVKGRVIGYDDLLEQVKLDQCTILK